MDTVQKCRILQLWRENCKEVFVTGCWLPPFNVRVDVASEHHRALGRKLLITAAELAGLHVVLQHTDTCFGIFKTSAGNLIEEDHVFESHYSEFTGCLVIEKRGRRRFAARHDE